MNTQMRPEWYDLMEECFDLREDRDAQSFFQDVESLAKVLYLICNTEKEFNATEAYNIWLRTQDDVAESIDEILNIYGDDLDGLPEVGLKYFGNDNILAVGVYDRGNFDVVAGWEFRQARPLELPHDLYTDESPSSCGAE